MASWVQEELTRRVNRVRTRGTVSSLEIKLNGRETKMLTNYGNTEYREEVVTDRTKTVEDETIPT